MAGVGRKEGERGRQTTVGMGKGEEENYDKPVVYCPHARTRG